MRSAGPAARAGESGTRDVRISCGAGWCPPQQQRFRELKKTQKASNRWARKTSWVIREAKQTRSWDGRRTKLPEPVPRERKPGKPARLCGFLACRSCLFPDYGESDQSTIRRNRADAAVDGASCWAGLLVPSWNVHAAPHDAASNERQLLTGLRDRTEPSQRYSKRQRQSRRSNPTCRERKGRFLPSVL